jgi:hypothetical protein
MKEGIKTKYTEEDEGEEEGKIKSPFFYIFSVSDKTIS